MQAWVGLTPKDRNATNGERYGVDLPDVSDEYGHLTAWLHEIGTCGIGFNGLIPLTFIEIEAWSRMVDIKLSSFEATTLRNMSAAYSVIASNPDAKCPIDSDLVDDQMRESEGRAAAESFKAFAR